MTVGEYHTAARDQSKKLQFMNVINDCMGHASSCEKFIALMESEGYKVRWEASRMSSITSSLKSTLPSRKRFKNSSLPVSGTERLQLQYYPVH